ncbi:MAG: hypothetical protein K1X55_08005 [Chitinophagales bacterium]|nr:hypothetical protein [Chitinophagales bacterium]
MFSINLRLYFSIILLVLVSKGFSQESTPYSRYGLGYIGDYNFIQSSSMGGLGTAYRSWESVSFINPASYSELYFTSFEAAVSAAVERLKTTTLKDSRGNGGLNYLALSFPAGKHVGISAGMVPFSKKDYLLTDTSTFIGTDGEKLVKEFEGDGGIYNLYFGSGVKIKGFSLGANFGYMFGKLINNSFAYPLDEDLLPDANSSTTWKYNNLRVKGIYYNFGAQYSDTVKTKKEPLRITVGISGNPGIKLGKLSQLDEGTYTFNTEQFYGPVPRAENQGIEDFIQENLITDYVDTLKESLNQKTQVKIPGTLNMGIMFDQGLQWKAGVDFRYQPWKNYQGYESNGASVLQSSWRIGVGGEYLPNPDLTGKYSKKIKYRAGFNYTKSNIIANSTSINEYGFSLGFGLPILNTIANDEGFLNKSANYSFNFGVEAGARGTTKNNLLQESFVRFKFGFSFNDRWFVKRKFN